MEEQYQAKRNELSSEMLPFKKQILLLAVGWIGFRILATIIEIIVGLAFSKYLGVSFKEALSNYSASMIINASAYIVLLVLLLFIAYSDLNKLVKSFKQYQSYIAGVVCVVAIFAFNIFYNMIVQLLKTPVTDNINQQSLESLESLYPVTSMIVFGFIGPICEELTYRVGLFSACKRKSRVLAYAVTIVVFSLIHFNYSTKYLVNELLNLPFYAFAAVAFSFTYDHFGFAGSVTAHILNNVISLAFVTAIR